MNRNMINEQKDIDNSAMQENCFLTWGNICTPAPPSRPMENGSKGKNTFFLKNLNNAAVPSKKVGNYIMENTLNNKSAILEYANYG